MNERGNDTAPAKIRADRLLVERGLFHSRAAAQAAIDAGLVKIGGSTIAKAAQLVPVEAEVAAQSAHPYVSRGGVKLAAAIEHFGFEIRHKICLDAGASTGGFTDILLRAGARRVYAVDVGTGQLHAALRQRPEVVSMERTDIRALRSADLDPPPEVVVIDVSFIPLKLVLPAVSVLAAPAASLIALVKPQFEAGPRAVKKGIVRDRAAAEAARDEVVAAARGLGWQVRGVIDSPILGGEGNREYLLGAERTARPGASV